MKFNEENEVLFPGGGCLHRDEPCKMTVTLIKNSPVKERDEQQRNEKIVRAQRAMQSPGAEHNPQIWLTINREKQDNEKY